MIVGIISSSAHAETLLNNLSEADFNLKDVSVIMRDQKTRDAIARDAGPFKGLAPADLTRKLGQVGLANQEVKQCADAVTQGKVLIVMSPPPAAEAAAAEMLKDASAEFVKVVHQ